MIQAKQPEPAQPQCVWYAVRLSDGRWLRLRNNWAAERVDEAERATQFRSYQLAQLAVQALNEPWYEIFALEGGQS